MNVRQPWVWTGLLVSTLIIGGIFEWRALGDPEGLTFSQYVATAFYHWLPLIYIVGAINGGLVVHFLWPWVPKEKRVICGQCGYEINERKYNG